MTARWAVAALCVASLWGCGESEPAQDVAQAWSWGLPAGVPEPRVPADNPMSRAKVDLGRWLFYDKRLSIDEDFSCASCHAQSKAFSDGRARAEGTTGQLHPRNSMALVNVAYNRSQTWANPLLATLEDQALDPLFADDPVELGMSDNEDLLLERLRAEPRYVDLFARAFPEADDPIDLDGVRKALASFERTMLSFDAPYDRWVAGDDGAMSASAQRGMALFFSERTECFHCHGGFNFSASLDHEGLALSEDGFHRNGLYALEAYAHPNRGVYEITGQDADRGRFRAPTLRNIALTAPYMHDGSLETLEEVVDHYARGGAEGAQASVFVPGFVLDEAERDDLVAFLEALTDRGFVESPSLSDPFAAQGER